MNFSLQEIQLLKELVLQKIEMPQYEDVNQELNSILEKLESEELVGWA
jgi:hypothetical protein